MISFAALRGILVLSLMKQCLNIVEIYFTTMDPAFFNRTNSTTEDDKITCTIQENIQHERMSSSMMTWIFAARYLLPVLGGLMSSAWLGYIRVLQIGGVVMLLATVFMSLSFYLGLMCESSAIIPITWLLLPLFFGLVQPNILYGFFLWYNEHRLLPTMIPALYYLGAESGEMIALLVSPLSGFSKLGNHSTLVLIALSVLFISLSFLLPKDPTREALEIPRWPRMRRYCLIFSGLILILLSVGDMRAKFYMVEILHFLSTMTYQGESTFLSPDWIGHSTKVTCCLVLIAIGFVYHQKFPVHPRLQTGILLESAVEFCLLIFTAVGSPNLTAVVALYSVLSVVDGIAEMLVMIAIYDLVQLTTPKKLKAIVFGIVFTEWGLANSVSECFVFGLDSIPFWAYHLMILGALIACSLYYGYLAMPLAEQMTLVEYAADDNDEDERRPLLDSTVA